jgi:hypothetical protein
LECHVVNVKLGDRFELVDSEYRTLGCLPPTVIPPIIIGDVVRLSVFQFVIDEFPAVAIRGVKLAEDAIIYNDIILG